MAEVTGSIPVGSTDKAAGSQEAALRPSVGRRGRVDAGLLDVPLGSRPSSHGDVGADRRPDVDSLVRFHPFGVYENGSGPAVLLALPEIVWEASLGIYCVVKGFRPSPITSELSPAATAEPRLAGA